MIGLYLLHFDPPLAHARHYLGWSDDIDNRIARHMSGRGSPLVRAVVANHSKVELVRIWDGATRTDEARLKKQGSLARVCPICAPMTTKGARAHLSH